MSFGPVLPPCHGDLRFTVCLSCVLFAADTALWDYLLSRVLLRKTRTSLIAFWIARIALSAAVDFSCGKQSCLLFRAAQVHSVRWRTQIQQLLHLLCVFSCHFEVVCHLLLVARMLCLLVALLLCNDMFRNHGIDLFRSLALIRQTHTSSFYILKSLLLLCLV